MKKSQKIIHYGSMIVIVLSIFTLLYCFYLLWWDENPPIVFNENPLPVENKIIHSCGYVNLIPSGCRYTDAPAYIYWSFVDGFEYTMTPLKFSGITQKGECFTNLNVKSYPVPSTLPSGKYKLMGTLKYKVNPLADRIVNWETEEFEIINDGVKC